MTRVECIVCADEATGVVAFNDDMHDVCEGCRDIVSKSLFLTFLRRKRPFAMRIVRIELAMAEKRKALAS